MILTEKKRQTLFGMFKVEMAEVEELIKISDEQDENFIIVPMEIALTWLLKLLKN